MIVSKEGSLVTFTPEGDIEHEWLVSNTNAEPWQWLGRSLAVDARIAVDLYAAVVDAGLITDGAV